MSKKLEEKLKRLEQVLKIQIHNATEKPTAILFHDGALLFWLLNRTIHPISKTNANKYMDIDVIISSSENMKKEFYLCY